MSSETLQRNNLPETAAHTLGWHVICLRRMCNDCIQSLAVAQEEQRRDAQVNADLLAALERLKSEIDADPNHFCFFCGGAMTHKKTCIWHPILAAICHAKGEAQ
jgi:hypothetical protein